LQLIVCIIFGEVNNLSIARYVEMDANSHRCMSGLKRRGTGSKKPKPSQKIKQVYSVDFYCSSSKSSVGERQKKTRLLGTITNGTFMINRIITPSDKSTSDVNSNIKDAGNVSLSGNPACSHCSQPLSIFCDSCSKWYCGSGIQSSKSKSGDNFTCPIHGTFVISGTRDIEANQNNDPKKK